jgi:uncharacterized protein (DUF362 family)
MLFFMTQLFLIEVRAIITNRKKKSTQTHFPHLIVLDGIDAFVDGGPMTGKRANGSVFLAGTDRVAIDAVGVAILKSLGSNDQIMRPKIFDQEQIARAAELGIGVSSASEIELVPVDDQSRESCTRVQEIVSKG